jgi:hypothetical protein
MRPKCAFTTWFPYRKGISPLGFIHTYNKFLRLDMKDQSDNAYLVLGILRNVVQCGDMQLEFPTFTEFPEACTEADKIWSCNRYTQSHWWFGNIVDPVLLKSETVWLVWSVDEMYKIVALEDCEHNQLDR